MRWALPWALGLLVVDVAASTACALFPLRSQLSELQDISFWRRTYSPGDSNLDVWALSLGHGLLLVLFLLMCLGRDTSYSLTTRTRQYQRLLTVNSLIGLATEICLLTKAVLVAIYGSEQLLPSHHGRRDGLALLFGPLLVCSCLTAAEHLLLGSYISGRDCRGPQAGEEATPLLGEKDALKEVDKPAVGTFSTLIHLMATDASLLFVAFCAGAVAALGLALVPFYTGKIIDFATIDQDADAFRRTTLKLVAVSVVCAIFTGIRGGLFTLAMVRLNVRVRTRLFASLLSQDVGFYDVNKTGEITSRLAADTTTMADQFCLNLNVLMRSLTQAALVLAFMFRASWRLTVITFVLVPVSVAISKTFGTWFRTISKKTQKSLADANSVAEETLSTMTNVLAHAAQDSSKAAYGSLLRKFYVQQKRQAVLYTAYMVIATFLPNLISAIVLFYGGHLVLGGAMSAGDLVSFMLYQQSLASTFQTLGDIFAMIAVATGAADKVIELMFRKPRMPADGSLVLPSIQGRLEFSNVDFSYPGRPNTQVLHRLSFQVNPGEVVALVGPSGGGKSSVVKLLQRFYLPSGGAVRLDGRDLGLYSPKWLKRHIGLVAQEPTLYSRSIYRNIIYGLEEEDGMAAGEVPTMEAAQEAARLANIHETIQAMPQGYETECGDRGVQLSGGQRQRIAIARALVRRPEILLLDEATSALDADSEAAVQAALDALMKQHTVLVIAHRLSTIQDADRILLISKGRVEEQGSHTELLQRGGAYAALVRRQLQGNSSTASLQDAAALMEAGPGVRV